MSLIATALLAEVGASGADYMKSHTHRVCGSRVTFDLHPDWSPPGVEPKAVGEEEIPKPGDLDGFVHVMYDYKGSWKLDVDGSVIVEGDVMRQPASEDFSTFDVDRLIKHMIGAGSDFQYEKVERNGRIWIKRTKAKDVPAGGGRSREMEWLVPLRKDILLIFRVHLVDYGISGSSKRAAKWYPSAEAMQNRVFESLQVVLE